MTTFALTAVCVNWGRGYDPGEFRRNVNKVLTFVDGHEHVALLVQELDEEPDPAHEHAVFNSMLEPGSKKVWWRSREPIILSPGARAWRRRRVLTMGSGQDIGAPDGTGPARHAVTCVAKIEGVLLGVGNTHPHRSLEHPRVIRAREHGQEVFSQELRGVRRSHGGISGIWGADMNDRSVPKLVPGEKVAISRGLDHLRYWEHAEGARMKLLDTGTLNGTIDPHDPLWARWLVRG